MSDRIKYVSLLNGEDLPSFSENVILDYESIPILPEPDEAKHLRELNKDKIIDNMVSELTEGNWVYLEFEDALRMNVAQRESLLFAAGCVLDTFVGQSINDGTISNIKENIHCAYEEIQSVEDDPGIFGEKLAAAAAHKRLKNEEESENDEG